MHLGHLAVLDTRPMEASEEDAAALRIFAARASAELERRNQAKALAASRARVIEAADKERRRVGRDLHDGAQQRLLAVSNLLRVSRMKLDEDDPAHDLVARAEEELAQAHAELRKLARGLHPVALRERGLGQALASLCQASDVPIEVDVYEGELPLPLARGAYFVAAESLANAARYAQASKIDVRIAKEGERAGGRGERRRRRRRRHRRRGPGCSAWPTASTCSAAASRSTAPPAAAPASARRSLLAAA